MEGKRFDDVTRALSAAGATSRREILKGIAGSAIAGALALVGVRDAAADHGTCRHDGERCVTGSECCSGRCVKKSGTSKKFCRPAPGQGTCTTDQDACRGTIDSCNNDGRCNCQVRRNGFSVCALSGECAACLKDQDCEPKYGPGAMCVRCAHCASEDYTGCVKPCPTAA